MKITLDISRDYARVLLDHVIEDAACCDDHEREELEMLEHQLRTEFGLPLRRSSYKALPPIGMAGPNDKPF